MSETRSQDGEAPAVSIVVPVKNEAGNIAPLVAEIAAALGRQRAVRDRLCQRRLERRDGGRIGRPDGEPAVAAARSSMRHPADNRRRSAPACGMRGRRSWSPSTATARTIRPSFRRWSRRSRPARRSMGLVAGQRVGRQATGFKKLQSRIANGGARRACCATAPATPAAASRRFAATCFWRCPISTGCTGSCRRWCGAKATTSAMSTWSTGRAGTGVSNYGMWDRLWIGILDLAGVWWLIRRKTARARGRGGETEC